MGPAYKINGVDWANPGQILIIELGLFLFEHEARLVWPLSNFGLKRTH